MIVTFPFLRPLTVSLLFFNVTFAIFASFLESLAAVTFAFEFTETVSLTLFLAFTETAETDFFPFLTTIAAFLALGFFVGAGVSVGSVVGSCVGATVGSASPVTKL